MHSYALSYAFILYFSDVKVRFASPEGLAVLQVALSIYELHGTSALNLLTGAAGMGGRGQQWHQWHQWHQTQNS